MDDFTHTFSGVVHFSYTYNIDYTPNQCAEESPQQ